MSMGIGGFNANYNVVLQSTAGKSGQSATPTFAHNHTWGSISEMDTAFRNYGQEWRNVYSNSFAKSGTDGNGKISQDELNELLQKEFGSKGVQFTDGPVDVQNPKEGRYEVYIDDKNRQKMADDPEYRAKVMSVIQLEMAGAGGYSLQGPGGVRNDRTTGLSMSMAEGDPIFEGVPHSAGGTSASKGIGTFSMSSDGMSKGGVEKEKKSLLEQIKEAAEEKLKKKKEEEKRAAAKKAREDLLELSVEATTATKTGTVEKTAATGAAARQDDAESANGAVNVIA